MFVNSLPMPPITQTKLSGEEVGKILAKLEQHDELLKELKAQNECILEGINGTPQHIGLSGMVRNLVNWREEIEAEETLVLQLKDLVDWQRSINRTLTFIGAPLSGAVLIAALAFLWGLLTHSIEIVPH